MNARCQQWEGVTFNGIRPQCEPAVARITHHHRGTTDLCQTCLDDWFDTADDDESIEPAAWSWLPGARPVT